MPILTLLPQATRAPKLTGKIATRAQARVIYGEIVAELNACEDASSLEAYLFTIGEELLQFENELEHLWTGDGEDFAGLNKEVQAAVARCGVDW
jgi:hypothetical protein